MDDLSTLEVIGCESGFWACALEGWGGEVTAYLLILGTIAAAVAVVYAMWARDVIGDRVRHVPRSMRRSRVVGGPELLDGSWIRLVEIAPGYLRAEVYAERTWQPLYRNPTRFFDAAMRSHQQLGPR